MKSQHPLICVMDSVLQVSVCLKSLTQDPWIYAPRLFYFMIFQNIRALPLLFGISWVLVFGTGAIAIWVIGDEKLRSLVSLAVQESFLVFLKDLKDEVCTSFYEVMLVYGANYLQLAFWTLNFAKKYWTSTKTFVEVLYLSPEFWDLEFL